MRSLEAELFHADGQTDRQTENGWTHLKRLIVAICNFANEHKCQIIRFKYSKTKAMKYRLIYFIQALLKKYHQIYGDNKNKGM
jgi:hypothetical protein